MSNANQKLTREVQVRREKSATKIVPIRTKAEINAVRKAIGNNIRDLLLFDMATQLGIGMTDLLRLKAGDLEGVTIGDPVRFRGITGNQDYHGYMTDTLFSTWQNYVQQTSPSPDDYLFGSRKGHKPLNLSSVSTMVASWFQKAGLVGLSGAKSLKKTWELHFKSDEIQMTKDGRNLEPSIRPVIAEPVKDRVYREISRAIISGRLAPGERLLEEKIAHQMKVSRMPVREALHRLQESGFISAYKKSGKIVNQLSRKSLDEITTIRMMMETEASRKAIVNLKDAALKRLEDLHALLVEAIEQNNIDEMLKLNKQFHFTFYAEADMPILQQMITGLWDRVSPYLHILLREGDARASSQDVKRDHKGMLEGMRKRDPEMVCKWLKADLIEGKEMVYRLMKRWNIE